MANIENIIGWKYDGLFRTQIIELRNKISSTV